MSALAQKCHESLTPQGFLYPSLHGSLFRLSKRVPLFTRQAYTQLQRILLQHDLLVFPALCGTTPQIGRKAQLFFMNHQHADTALKGAGEKWNMCQRKEKAGSSVLTVV